MFTGMCSLQMLVLSNLSKLTICSCILFICLSLTFFLFQWQLKICILCGFIGHLHWTCHQRGCFRCGCPGHMTRDCTEPSFSKWHPCFRCGMQGHNKKVMVFCASVYEIVFFGGGWKKIYKVWQFFPNWYNWKFTRGSKTITKINLSVYLIKF